MCGHINSFQQYLTAFGSTVTVPLVLYKSFCMDEDKVGLSELISTIFFVSGIATLIQTMFGTRYGRFIKQVAQCAPLQIFK